MNPYNADPDRIPSGDRYADLPFYGRYLPRQDDFRIDTKHVNSDSEHSLQYWADVVALCSESNILYPADEGRDVFAAGSVVIKSSRRHSDVKVDYSCADANEVQAIAIAKRFLEGVKVPDIYFAGMINGRAVLIQERLPGVSLTVVFPYLAEDQKPSFKHRHSIYSDNIQAIPRLQDEDDWLRPKVFMIRAVTSTSGGRPLVTAGLFMRQPRISPMIQANRSCDWADDGSTATSEIATDSNNLHVPSVRMMHGIFQNAARSKSKHMLFVMQLNPRVPSVLDLSRVRVLDKW